MEEASPDTADPLTLAQVLEGFVSLGVIQPVAPYSNGQAEMALNQGSTDLPRAFAPSVTIRKTLTMTSQNWKPARKGRMKTQGNLTTMTAPRGRRCRNDDEEPVCDCELMPLRDRGQQLSRSYSTWMTQSPGWSNSRRHRTRRRRRMRNHSALRHALFGMNPRTNPTGGLFSLLRRKPGTSSQR
ncbi:hypothetical protein KFL_002550010, partial [Klebsormidium nitens]